MPLVAVATLECHWPQWCFNAKKHGSLQSLHGSSFSEMGGGDIVKQMSDQTGQLLGGPPRKDLKDEKIFSDEQSEGMEKLQQMDRDSETHGKEGRRAEGNGRKGEEKCGGL